jgi:hypothetical protein
MGRGRRGAETVWDWGGGRGTNKLGFRGVWLWAGRIDGRPAGERWAVSSPRAGRMALGERNLFPECHRRHSGTYIFFLVFLPPLFL